MAPKILIIDDDPDIREALGSFLDMEGYEVILSSDGPDALERLKSGLVPCLILLDHRMPRMTGAQLMDRIRAEHPRIAHTVPILVMSAAKQPHMEGVTDFLDKPFQVQALIQKVAEHCGVPEPALT